MKHQGWSQPGPDGFLSEGKQLGQDDQIVVSLDVPSSDEKAPKRDTIPKEGKQRRRVTWDSRLPGN